MASTTYEEALRRMKGWFEGNVIRSMTAMLQEKHLYQSITVAAPAMPKKELKTSDGKALEVDQWPALTAFVSNPWAPQAPDPRQDVCCCAPPTVKLFCKTCKRIEPYNLAYAEDTLGRIGKKGAAGGDTQQAFLFAYECQSCKGIPELFMVRRRGLRLTNEGRSPMENVAVPAAVPKVVKPFFGGAIVAHQSGQTLAGLFLLRTLVEQWARASTGSQKKEADKVMEDYMGSLPQDFRARFPSMRDLYGELSADLHAATGSPELFDSALQRIDEHFDIRRAFKLSANPAAAEPSIGAGAAQEDAKAEETA